MELIDYLPIFILLIVLIIIAIVKDHRRKEDMKAMKAYYKHSDEIMQEHEDKKWDRLIEENARRLFNDWKFNYELPGEEWRKPILLWYIEGMIAYRVSNIETARYLNRDIDLLVTQRYNELKHEYSKKIELCK